MEAVVLPVASRRSVVGPRSRLHKKVLIYALPAVKAFSTRRRLS